MYFSSYLISVILESLLFPTEILQDCDRVCLYHLSCARQLRLIQSFSLFFFFLFTSVVIFLIVFWTMLNLSLVFISCRARPTVHLWKNCSSNRVLLLLLKILMYFLKDHVTFFFSWHFTGSPHSAGYQLHIFVVSFLE